MTPPPRIDVPPWVRERVAAGIRAYVDRLSPARQIDAELAASTRIEFLFYEAEGTATALVRFVVDDLTEPIPPVRIPLGMWRP